MARRLLRRARRAGPVDVLLTHAPPLGLGDGDDQPHEGIEALHTVIERLQPSWHLHGHIHPYGRQMPDRELGRTTIRNVIPWRMVDIEPRSAAPRDRLRLARPGQCSHGTRHRLPTRGRRGGLPPDAAAPDAVQAGALDARGRAGRPGDPLLRRGGRRPRPARRAAARPAGDPAGPDRRLGRQGARLRPAVPAHLRPQPAALGGARREEPARASTCRRSTSTSWATSTSSATATTASRSPARRARP